MTNDTVEAHWPKIREGTVRVNGREYPRVILDFGTLNGRRTRKTFKTREAADRALEKWRAEQKILARQIGNGAKRFVTGAVQDAAAALHVLGPGASLAEAATLFKTVRDAGLGLGGIRDAAGALPILNGKATLIDAARFYMDRHFPEGGERTVDQLVEDYIRNRQEIDRRPATIRDIRGNLGRANPASVERKRGGSLRLAPTGFALDFTGVPVAHVTTADLERWMERHKAKAKATRRNIRVHLVGLFNFAKDRKFIKENPAELLGTPNTSKTRPYVMPVEDVDAVMRYAAANAPETVPYFALALFAGIRPQGELSRVTWADISFERNEIDIRADVSKTGDERFIEMSQNLVAWLLPHRKAAGPIDAPRAAVERVRRGAGVRWEPDCMRHSFGSYHMAQHENAGKTALQMGHRQIDTTFEHYRRAVRKEDAAKFWNIRPATAEETVIQFRANAG